MRVNVSVMASSSYPSSPRGHQNNSCCLQLNPPTSLLSISSVYANNTVRMRFPFIQRAYRSISGIIFSCGCAGEDGDWVTPPAMPPPYTPLIQTAPSTSSTLGLVHRGFWNSQQASDWSTHSPTPSLLKVSPRLCGHHLQQRSSAHSLVEAVSDAIQL
ncbi:hypothetical protein QQF64_031453 [Cirrhinus molitorella]|uniref:Uncharacterized protein n=1 Tax=Cirrhinus molitorella TaxID=172907 RepID=A0ABR3MWZ5_9TELE